MTVAPMKRDGTMKIVEFANRPAGRSRTIRQKRNEEMTDQLTGDEKDILDRAITTADEFGLSYIKSAKNALELEGFMVWKPEYERYIFNKVI
ncbi:MAG: hypothetical protein WC476_12990 [Phycisphaerae bacterium]|jgi:hypothetical protein